MNPVLPLVEQLSNLERLQELDLKIDSLKKEQGSLPVSLKVVTDSLNKCQATLNSKKALISEIEKVHRQTQAALDLNRDRLTRSSSKLEAVHNSVEFQAASKEIEQLKKLNLTLEEQDKKSCSEIEVGQKSLKDLEDQVQKLQKERDTQAESVSSQETKFKKDIDHLMSERAVFSSKVEVKIMNQYNRIRPARGGLGIVPAVGGRCKGCNMMVPPQLYNEISRGSALHSCPSCHRLLYMPAAPGTLEVKA